MKKTLLVTLVGVVVLAGCSQKGEAMNQSQENTNPICSTQNLTGGWSKSDITPQAEQALDAVLGQMNTAAELKQILSVRTQVVAGLNYAIEFEMDNVVVESNCLIAAGAVVLENSHLESNCIYAGIPAKKVKELSPEQFKDTVARIADNYVKYASWYQEEE